MRHQKKAAKALNRLKCLGSSSAKSDSALRRDLGEVMCHCPFLLHFLHTEGGTPWRKLCPRNVFSSTFPASGSNLTLWQCQKRLDNLIALLSTFIGWDFKVILKLLNFLSFSMRFGPLSASDYVFCKTRLQFQ